MRVMIEGTYFSLAEFCRKFVLDEKIFVVPSFRIGHQVGERLAAEGHAWVNLRFMTPASLAQETAALEMSSQKIKLLSETQELLLVKEIFEHLKKEKKLKYFAKIKPSFGVARTLLQSLKALRMAGQTSGRLDPNKFFNQDKGREVCMFFRSYEEKLMERREIDTAGLFYLAEKAANKSKPDKKRIFLYFADEVLSEVEKRFLVTIGGEDLVPVLRGEVFGLQQPRRFLDVGCKSEREYEGKGESGSLKQNGVMIESVTGRNFASDAERLPWLFAPEQAPAPVDDGSIELFKATGPANECREILRRLLQNNIPLDRVEIIHPPGENYPAIFYLLCEAVNFTATYAGGFPVSFTRPGKVFSGLLDWLESDYQVTVLCGMIESGALTVPSSQKTIRCLKQAAIGWGRERYLKRLADLEAEFAGQIRAGEVKKVKELVHGFLDCLPDTETEGLVELESLCAGITGFLNKFSIVRNPLDGAAQAAFICRLNEVTEAFMPREEALEWLRCLTDDLTVGAAGPIPGHLYLSDYFSGGYSGREISYIIGLDQSAFSDAGIQDPILLDEERKEISLSLSSTSDIQRENLYALARMFSALRGKISLSYPSYNILENKPSFPSSVLLQAFRLREGDPKLDYTKLRKSIPDSSGYLPGTPNRALDEIDWWLSRLYPNKDLCFNGSESVKLHFPDLGRGISALKARQQEPLTPYDGLVEIDPLKLHPVLNHDIKMSATKLETLAICPFKYLLHYVLEIRPPDEVEYDPSRWLDAMQRGSLLHEIFYRFMFEVWENGEQVDFSEHKKLLFSIAEKIISGFRENIPPPSKEVFEREQDDIISTMLVFLKVESERKEPVEPVLFEVFFGIEKQAGKGVEEAADITIGPGKSFQLQGRIDRIDRLGKNRFRVVDYKTGRYSTYEDLKFFGRGKNIQHAVYGIAAEQIIRKLGLDENPEVVKSGYFFPTQKGDGREILVGKFDRIQLQKLLSEILGLIERGEFIVNPDAWCDYCDYLPVCGTGAVVMAKTRYNSGMKEFSIFTRLKDYP